MPATTQSEMHKLVELAKRYTALSDRYLASDINPIRDPNDKENPSDNEHAAAHYMSVGYSAMRITVGALLGNMREPPKSILDFPCGSGRVTRHLRAMFPNAKIGACDLYRSHIDFCLEHFAAVPIPSKENLDDLHIGSDWDLVFCGSLLTHLPAQLFKATIRFIIRSLSPTGIAIATLEGRHSEHIQDHKWKMIDDDLFNIARELFHTAGFGFVDYENGFKKNFPDQQSYGIALTRPNWAIKYLEQYFDIRILGLTERAWDDHQDIVVFGKPGVNA